MANLEKMIIQLNDVLLGKKLPKSPQKLKEQIVDVYKTYVVNLVTNEVEDHIQEIINNGKIQKIPTETTVTVKPNHGVNLGPMLKVTANRMRSQKMLELLSAAPSDVYPADYVFQIAWGVVSKSLKDLDVPLKSDPMFLYLDNSRVQRGNIDTYALFDLANFCNMSYTKKLLKTWWAQAEKSQNIPPPMGKYLKINIILNNALLPEDQDDED